MSLLLLWSTSTRTHGSLRIYIHGPHEGAKQGLHPIVFGVAQVDALQQERGLPPARIASGRPPRAAALPGGRAELPAGQRASVCQVPPAAFSFISTQALTPSQ